MTQYAMDWIRNNRSGAESIRSVIIRVQNMDTQSVLEPSRTSRFFMPLTFRGEFEAWFTADPVARHGGKVIS